MTRRRKVLLALLLALALFFGYVALAGRAHDPGPPLRVSATLLPSEGAFQVESLLIQTTHGPNLDCLVRRPLADSGLRLPAVLAAGGFRTGKRAVLAAGDAFRGVALACDYPWANPGRTGALRLVATLPQLRGALVSTPLAHQAAADYLLSRPDVDTTRLVALGVSLGVPTIAAWAADDQRVAAVALLYGGARLDHLLEKAGERQRWPAWLRKPLAPLLAGLLRPIEPMRTVPRIAPRPLFIAIAPDDERIPRVSSEALAAAAGPQAHVLRLSGAHVTPRAEALLTMLTDSTLAWLDRVWVQPAPPR